MKALRIPAARGTPCPTNYRVAAGQKVLFGRALYDERPGNIQNLPSDERSRLKLEENFARAKAIINPYLTRDYGCEVGTKLGSGMIGTVFGLNQLTDDESKAKFSSLVEEANKGVGRTDEYRAGEASPVIKITADEGEAAFVDFLLNLRRNYEDPFHKSTTRPYPAMLPRYVELYSACPGDKKAYFIVREDIAGVGSWEDEDNGVFSTKPCRDRFKSIYYPVTRRVMGRYGGPLPDKDELFNLWFSKTDGAHSPLMLGGGNYAKLYLGLQSAGALYIDRTLRSLIGLLHEVPKDTALPGQSFTQARDLWLPTNSTRKELYRLYFQCLAMRAVIEQVQYGNLQGAIDEVFKLATSINREYKTAGVKWTIVDEPSPVSPEAALVVPQAGFAYEEGIESAKRSLAMELHIEEIYSSMQPDRTKAFRTTSAYYRTVGAINDVVTRFVLDAMDFWKFTYFNGIGSSDLHIANWGVVMGARPRLVVRDLGFPVRAATYADSLPRALDPFTPAANQLAGIGTFGRYSSRARKPRIILRGAY